LKNLSKLYIEEYVYTHLMETITIAKDEYEGMKHELESLRNTALYKRLLDFEKNIAEGKKFTRKDLGF